MKSKVSLHQLQEGNFSMYGMVNDAVRGLVLSAFGEESWNKIYTRAEAPESFVAMQTYDDDITYNLVGAAVEVLQIDAHTVLQTFGKYWVSDVATKHYASLMDNTGISFVDFVKIWTICTSAFEQPFPIIIPLHSE